MTGVDFEAIGYGCKIGSPRRLQINSSVFKGPDLPSDPVSISNRLLCAQSLIDGEWVAINSTFWGWSAVLDVSFLSNDGTITLINNTFANNEETLLNFRGTATNLRVQAGKQHH